MRSRFPQIAVSLAIGLVATVTCAGELDPPAGPVAPTMKDLATVEPRTALRNDFDTLTPIVISEPGSYYLAENIQGLPNQHGIEITASGVTLDLRGFRIVGNQEVGSNNGIHLGAGVRNVSISGGTITGFFGHAIEGSTAASLRISDVNASFNGAAGFRCGDASVISRCVAQSNTGHGFDLGSGCTVSDSTASSCDDGFAIGPAGQARGCTAEDNSDDGFRLDDGAIAANCTSRSNGGDGFDLSDSAATECVASLNQTNGFLVARSTLRASTAQFNTVYGINADESIVDSCHALRNQDSGIYLDDHCVVTDCLARDNGPFDMFIPGIEVFGTGNRVQGNTATGNDIGLVVQGTGNFIVQNTLHANGFANHSIVAGNAVGPVLDVTGTDITTTNPWRNFEH